MKKKLMLVALCLGYIICLTSCDKAYDIPKMNEVGINISKSDYNEKLQALLDYGFIINNDLVIKLWDYSIENNDDEKSSNYSKTTITYDYQNDFFLYEYALENKSSDKELSEKNEEKAKIQYQPYVEEYIAYDLLTYEYKNREVSPVIEVFPRIDNLIDYLCNKFFSSDSEYYYSYYQSKNIYTAEYASSSIKKYLQIQHRGNDILVYYSFSEKGSKSSKEEYNILQIETVDVELKAVNHEKFMLEVQE